MASVSCGMTTQTQRKRRRSTSLPSKTWWSGLVSIKIWLGWSNHKLSAETEQFTQTWKLSSLTHRLVVLKTCLLFFCWKLSTLSHLWSVLFKRLLIVTVVKKRKMTLAITDFAAVCVSKKKVKGLCVKWHYTNVSNVNFSIDEHFSRMHVYLFVCSSPSLRVQTILCHARLWSLPASLRSCCWSHSQVRLQTWCLSALCF